MRFIGLWLWMMMNLIVFGMVGYMYLLWVQFWKYSNNHNPTFAASQPRSFMVDIGEDSSNIKVRRGRPLIHPGSVDVEYLGESESTMIYPPIDEEGERFEKPINYRAIKEMFMGRKENSIAEEEPKSADDTKGPEKPKSAEDKKNFDGSRTAENTKGPGTRNSDDGSDDLSDAMTTAIPKEELLNRIEKHKMFLTVQLRTSQMDGGNILFKHENRYGVIYPRKQSKTVDEIQDSARADSVFPLAPTAEELLRELKRAEVRALRDGDEPFTSEGLAKYFPSQGVLEGQHFNNCAVVSSAGTLKGSRLGKFIDSHDAVVRFNHAPVNGFKRDVGSKTTLRIINSQIIAKPEFKFWDSDLYSNVSLLVWDPCNYTSNLSQWYKSPDFDFFPDYFKRRLMLPQESLHLLHPHSLWNLWRAMQKFIHVRMLPNPPSSGFLGVALMLAHCRTVTVVEFLPSVRLSRRCHYWRAGDDSGCYFGSWHPLATEKLLTMVLNRADDVTTYHKGYATLKGFSQLEN